MNVQKILSSRPTPVFVAKLGQLLFALVIQDDRKNVRDKSGLTTEAEIKRDARLRTTNIESIAAGIDSTDEIGVYAATEAEINEELQKRANMLAGMSGWLGDFYRGLYCFDAENPAHANVGSRRVVGTPTEGPKVEFDLIVPEFMALDGNQRLKNFPEAQLVRQGLMADAYKSFPVESAEEPELGFWATQFDRPINDQERELWQTRDNAMESAGFQALTLAENLTSAVSTVKNGGNEAKLTAPKGPFPRGTAQKMFRWATICTRWPQLKIEERCKLPATDPRSVDLSRATWQELDKAFGLKNPGPKLTVNKAEEALQSLKASRVIAPKAMSREDLERVAEANDSLIVREVAKGILSPNSDILTGLSIHAATYNAVAHVLSHGTSEAKAALDNVLATYASEFYKNASEIEASEAKAKASEAKASEASEAKASEAKASEAKASEASEAKAKASEASEAKAKAKAKA